MDQIAEIDDAVWNQHPIRIRPRDDIVVGYIVMNGMNAQRCGVDLHLAVRGMEHRPDMVAHVRVHHLGQHVLGHLHHALQIPLHRTVETRMAKIGETPGHIGDQRAQGGAGFFGQELGARERRSIEKFEQPGLIVLAAHRERQDLLAVERATDAGHPDALAPEMLHRRVLCIEFDCVIGGPVDLEHECAFRAFDTEIAVLLAAEFGQTARQAVFLDQDRARIDGGNIRARQVRALECGRIQHDEKLQRHFLVVFFQLNSKIDGNSTGRTLIPGMAGYPP